MIIKLLYTNESFYAVFVYKLPLYFYTLYLALLLQQSDFSRLTIHW